MEEKKCIIYGFFKGKESIGHLFHTKILCGKEKLRRLIQSIRQECYESALSNPVPSKYVRTMFPISQHVYCYPPNIPGGPPLGKVALNIQYNARERSVTELFLSFSKRKRALMCVCARA